MSSSRIDGQALVVTWEADDGYVGKASPQTTRIDLCELEGMERDELEQYVEDSVREDFLQKVTPCVNAFDVASEVLLHFAREEDAEKPDAS